MYDHSVFGRHPKVPVSLVMKSSLKVEIHEPRFQARICVWHTQMTHRVVTDPIWSVDSITPCSACAAW